MNLDPKTDPDPDPDPGSTKILDPDPRLLKSGFVSRLFKFWIRTPTKIVPARSFIIQNPSFYPSPFKINRNVIYSLNTKFLSIKNSKAKHLLQNKEDPYKFFKMVLLTSLYFSKGLCKWIWPGLDFQKTWICIWICIYQMFGSGSVF